MSIHLSESHLFKAPATSHFVGGRWIASQEALDVQTPASNAVIRRIARGSEPEVDAAVNAARSALEGPWGQMSATQRGRLLVQLSERILADLDRLAWVEAQDTGKPISLARSDIRVLARYFEFYGSGADKVPGQVIPFEEGYSASVVRVPHGVTAHIVPWNNPAQMFGRSVAPALAMGNAAVVKPAEDACLTSLEIAEAARELGLPAGALNVVTGLGHEAGAALTAHPGIDYISFTGSPEVGTLVQQAAAVNHVAVCLELGGKSPQIVFDDADLHKAAATVVKAITQNAGQTCSAGSRVLIQHSIFDRFTAMLADGFGKLRLGEPSQDADLGPVINRRQMLRVEQFVERAKGSGVPLICRTPLGEGLPPDGHYVAPALFGPVPRDHELAREEVFGPVLAAIPFDDEADAVALANSTDYALVAAVWTRDGDRQARMAKKVDAGQFFINCYGAGGGVELPFGGNRKSGHGREKGWLALEEFSTTKTVVHYHG